MGQAFTGWLTVEHCILRSAERRAEQGRVGPRLDYMAAMQCKPPSYPPPSYDTIIILTTTTIAVPPPH